MEVYIFCMNYGHKNVIIFLSTINILETYQHYINLILYKSIIFFHLQLHLN